MSPADVAALLALGAVAGFALWFPAGWVARGDENREALRQRARRDRQRPRPTRPLPRPVRAATAHRADRHAPAVGAAPREVTR